MKHMYLLLRKEQERTGSNTECQEEVECTEGHLEICIQYLCLWKPKLHSWHLIFFLADTPCKIDQ